ncbi:uncharacterized protein LY79DRAFT_558130, partial [Colletotrichum navitas]
MQFSAARTGGGLQRLVIRFLLLSIVSNQSPPPKQTTHSFGLLFTARLARGWVCRAQATLGWAGLRGDFSHV